MKAVRLILVAAASATAAAALVIALDRWRAVRARQAQLAAATNERDASRTRVAALEKDLVRSERRALEAERDTAELLRAVNSSRTPSAVVGAKRTESPAPSSSPTRVTVASPAAAVSAEEAERLAQQRAYQQSLAKKRAAEARQRAEFDLALVSRPPAEQFALLIQAARERAAAAEIPAAARLLKQAFALKPPDLAISDDVTALQQMIATQSKPIAVTFTSDNLTWVSIVDVRSPERFATATVSLPSGDYEVLGRRPGFRDVRAMLQVRTGATPPMVPVVCAEPL